MDDASRKGDRANSLHLLVGDPWLSEDKAVFPQNIVGLEWEEMQDSKKTNFSKMCTLMDLDLEVILEADLS